MMIIVYILLGIFIIFLLVLGFGLYLKKRGQLPFDKYAVEKDGGKYVTNKLGRTIEYFVYGNQDENAPVIVTIHGSGPEGLSEVHFHNEACAALKVKGISISLPGYGYTDEKPGRKVKDWASEDLEPVLDQEGVNHFMIMGHSQGTVHAMAGAHYFQNRCIGLGLNAPLLPRDLTKEIGLKGATGSDGLFRTEKIQKTSMGWYFTLLYLTTKTFAPWLPISAMAKGMKNKDDKTPLNVFGQSFKRAVARGTATWETALDVCYEWGFDPRQIECKNICVWHAEDDTWCPPEIGKWIAEYFGAKDGVNVNFKQDNLGYNHLTYVTKNFLKPENSLVKALIDGLKI